MTIWVTSVRSRNDDTKNKDGKCKLDKSSKSRETILLDRLERTTDVKSNL